MMRTKTVMALCITLDAPDGSETGEPLDRDAFDQWVSENVGNEENIPFQDLTEDAIRQIQ